MQPSWSRVGWVAAVLLLTLLCQHAIAQTIRVERLVDAPI